MFAALGGHLSVVKILLENNAQVDFRSQASLARTTLPSRHRVLLILAHFIGWIYSSSARGGNELCRCS